MMSQLIKVTLSYLYMAHAVLAYALTLQLIFEWMTSGVQLRTSSAFVAATLLATGLHRLARGPQRPVTCLKSTADRISHWVKPRRRLSFKFKVIAASIIISGAMIVAALEYLAFERTVTTAAGQVEHITLQEGTTVHVDARSDVKIEYTPQARIVHLREGGAVFEVAQDRWRPFLVKTPWVEMIAVDTRFGVSLSAGVIVTVAEGKVRVMDRVPDRTNVVVSPGQELQVPMAVAMSAHLAPVDAERKLQWTRGMLVFNGWTVAEAVAELNHRNSVKIIVDDPVLANKVVVQFVMTRADYPRSYAQLIATASRVRMTEGDGVIRLSQ